MVQHASVKFEHPHYVLQCTLCGSEYHSDPFRLWCDVPHAPALLRSVYRATTIEAQSSLPGIFQWIDWLPVKRWLDVGGKPITYASTRLARYLGLEQLYVSFNGYWPSRHACLMTGSFKELEAPSVLASVPENHPDTLVLASAGNTGRAFATLCSTLHIPLCLVIPEQSLSALWSKAPFADCICLIVVTEGGDYSDAIALAKLISQLDGFFPEGGAANVARRDGMGLTVIDAALTLGRIPDHYVQAVGSGTGGIAAWEANLRLLGDGRFGSHRMQLHLAQNMPFTPIVNAWKANSQQVLPLSEATARAQIEQTEAKVLTNRNPAYSTAGGVYQALLDTNGQMYAVTNEEAKQARHLFEQLEGIDISCASGVAVAALIQAVRTSNIAAHETVLLNITSGGIRQMQQDYPLYFLGPTLSFSPQEIRPDVVSKRMERYR